MAADYTRIVVFGDSMSDNGNLLALTGGTNPSDPPYWRGRYSNGPVWPEFLGSQLGLPVDNFAHGSALTGYTNLDGPYPGMRTQIDAYGSAHPNGVDPEALYLIWAGANDFFDLSDASGADAAAVAAIANITASVQQLADQGAQHIVVGNLPDLGLIPYADGQKALVPPALLTAGSRDFNTRLLAALRANGFPTRILDSFELTQEVAADPAGHGFVNAEDRCLSPAGVICPNPTAFLYWDDRHPTTAGHRVLAGFVARAAGALDTTRSTPGLFNPATAVFRLFESAAANAPNNTFRYGQADWMALSGDWNKDGVETIGLYNPVTARFFLRDENSTGPTTAVFRYGLTGFLPLSGDWDGDGTDTVGLYNPATGRFFLRNANSTGPTDITFLFGQPGQIPITGDWDGDGVDTVGTYNPASSRFLLLNAHAAGVPSHAFSFGQRGWLPVVGDWDSNGTDTAGLYDPDTGRFHLKNTHTSGSADINVKLKAAGRAPVAGDWDGPGTP
jgi:phospholipase/lecithinase/hemolysin